MKINAMEYIQTGRISRRRRWIIVTALLAVLAFCLCWAMLLLGNTIYPIPVVLSVLMGEEVKGATFAIETIRLPRMLAGLFAGFAFGISGYVFQTMLRNPLANPNVIGITSGSSAAAVFCIIVLQSSKAVISMASVIAGLLTAAVIYALARGNSFSIGRLILVGIGIQAMCNSAITYFMLIGETHDLPAAIRWMTGSLNGVKLDELPVLIISSFILVPLIYILGKPLMMLELGEHMATTLGVHTDRTRILLIVSAVLIVAIATSITGPIASIALLAGPIATRLAGAGGSNSIASGLVGANLVLAADLVGQFAFQVKFPVGIITAIIGAPYLLLLLIQMNRRGDF